MWSVSVLCLRTGYSLTTYSPAVKPCSPCRTCKMLYCSYVSSQSSRAVQLWFWLLPLYITCQVLEGGLCNAETFIECPGSQMLSLVPFFDKGCYETCFCRKNNSILWIWWIKTSSSNNKQEEATILSSDMNIHQVGLLSRCLKMSTCCFLTGCLHETASCRFLPGSHWRHAGSRWWQEWKRGTFFCGDLQPPEGFVVLHSRLAEVTGTFGKVFENWQWRELGDLADEWVSLGGKQWEMLSASCYQQVTNRISRGYFSSHLFQAVLFVSAWVGLISVPRYTWRMERKRPWNFSMLFSKYFPWGHSELSFQRHCWDGDPRLL